MFRSCNPIVGMRLQMSLHSAQTASGIHPVRMSPAKIAQPTCHVVASWRALRKAATTGRVAVSQSA
ncbi:hypothetical protein Vlu01_51160 [Micromonospora lutea]|uniref:Uncharacterized protein n=1 Tax=Micromonospora lutea TaxID=419825 RepID=A0ABQ4J2T0_9ACTN|nr:hypothetical protein Vlu01_51160 [Micromonospora lutea]